MDSQPLRRLAVRNFLLGTLFGIVVTTVGFQGLAKMADTGVSKIQEVTKEYAVK
jgi:hypothetical protein